MFCKKQTFVVVDVDLVVVVGSKNEQKNEQKKNKKKKEQKK